MNDFNRGAFAFKHVSNFVIDCVRHVRNTEIEPIGLIVWASFATGGLFVQASFFYPIVRVLVEKSDAREFSMVFVFVRLC